MSELEDRFVKRGYWTNWSQGSVMGQTLTVDSRTGNAVVAILTICTSVGAGQLWNLVAFLYHQYRAKGVPSDGLYWQQQALLRTLPTPTALIADYSKLWWNWHRKSKSALLRSLPVLLLALSFSALTIAAGILVSYIVTTSNLEVLVDSSLCAQVNMSRLLESQAGSSTSLWSSLGNVVQSYTQRCFQNTTNAPATCRNIFFQPRIIFELEPAPCPWHPSMCQDGGLSAIVMDSGLLDLNEWFGLNFQHRDRVWFRKKTICNVLPLEGHVDIRNVSDFNGTLTRDPLPGEQAVALRYGVEDRPASEQPEYMFIRRFSDSNATSTYTSTARIAYAYPDTTYQSWQPLESMNRTDADVALNVLWLNNVRAERTVEDPVFSAHRQYSIVYQGVTYTSYKPDTFGRVIGCACQYQFCTAQPNSKRTCTPLGALPMPTTVNTLLPSTGLQGATLALLRTVSRLNDITNAPSLNQVNAAELVAHGAVRELPNDQWVKEVVSWENYAWAGIMTMLADAAVGPKARDPSADDYTDAPISSGEKRLCRSLKMRKAGGFANINVFGLSFLVVFSGTVALLNFFILRFFIFLSRFRRALAPRLDRWVNDGLFQIQRRAFEANSKDVWMNLYNEVPITVEKTVFAELPTMGTPVEHEKEPIPKLGTTSDDRTQQSARCPRCYPHEAVESSVEKGINVPTQKQKEVAPPMPPSTQATHQ